MEEDQLASYGMARSDTEAEQLAKSATRWQQYQDQIRLYEDKLRTGKIEDVEDQIRIAKYAARELERVGHRATAAIDNVKFANEALIGDSNFLSVEFLEAGAYVARAVGRISHQLELGTGFHVGHNVILTNNHVLPSEEVAKNSVIELGLEEQRFGVQHFSQIFDLKPDLFFATDEDLDYTFVAANPVSRAKVELASYGEIRLDRSEGKVLMGMHVNIIGHPRGHPKRVVVRDNRLLFLSNDQENKSFCFYTADTQKGSSGSPVFNDHWELVALHHAGVPRTTDEEDPEDRQPLDRRGEPISPEEANANPELVDWIANEGIRISELVRTFESQRLKTEIESVRTELLRDWSNPVAPLPVQSVASESLSLLAGHRASLAPTAGGVTVPITIELNIDDGSN